YPLTRPQAWREQRTRLRQQRYDENRLNRTEQVGGFFTAASGGTVYTGDAFPEEYRGNVFTGDVNGNLIHRDILTPSGATFTARRAKEGVEFLASTDVWFRPCNFANAPDGNLYFTDIYREFIETPESIPDEIKKNMDFYAGDTMGRIYRIVPLQPRTRRSPRPSPGDLVAQLASPNGWHRMTAQRLLVASGDASVAGKLRDMAARHEVSLARLHALWTLEGLGALQAGDVRSALADAHPGVREHALRLAERFLPALNDAVIARASDPDPRVQFQLAFTLGEVRDARVPALLGAIAARHGADRWFRLAILTSVANDPLPLVTRLPHDSPVLPQLAALVGARRQPAEITALLGRIRSNAALDGLARGLRLVGARSLAVPESALTPHLSHDAAWEVARHFELRGLIARAAREAESGTPAERVRAVRALRGGSFPQAGPILRRVLASRPPPEVQAAAIESLSAFDDSEVASILIEHWRGYSPEARTKA
ncbi:MAG: DUF7133 domain-containing protein, partial [Bryobacteraceae bacterium]